MPKIVSQAQNRLMRAAAASPSVAKKTGVKQSVAKAAVKEAKGRKVGKLPQHVKPKR